MPRSEAFNEDDFVFFFFKSANFLIYANTNIDENRILFNSDRFDEHLKFKRIAFILSFAENTTV